jgi:hypothetical protein
MYKLSNEEFEEIGESIKGINECIQKWSYGKTILLLTTTIGIYSIYLFF